LEGDLGIVIIDNRDADNDDENKEKGKPKQIARKRGLFLNRTHGNPLYPVIDPAPVTIPAPPEYPVK
jgi:hypothetical protein